MRAITVTLVEMGTLALPDGLVKQARDLFQCGLELAREHALELHYPLYLRGLAEVAARTGRLQYAARLLGAMDPLINVQQLTILEARKPDLARTRRLVQSALSAAEFGAAYAEGHALDHDAPLTLALGTAARHRRSAPPLPDHLRSVVAAMQPGVCRHELMLLAPLVTLAAADLLMVRDAPRLT